MEGSNNVSVSVWVLENLSFSPRRNIHKCTIIFEKGHHPDFLLKKKARVGIIQKCTKVNHPALLVCPFLLVFLSFFFLKYFSLISLPRGFVFFEKGKGHHGLGYFLVRRRPIRPFFLVLKEISSLRPGFGLIKGSDLHSQI